MSKPKKYYDDPAALGLGDLIDEFVEMHEAARYWNDQDRNFAKAKSCRERREELLVELNKRGKPRLS